jgi:Uma2 family endonuclease/predicted transcriptional regulator
MSRQIAVRLPDDLVDFVDAVVDSGAERSRATVVTRALERERRRVIAARDAEILARAYVGPAGVLRNGAPSRGRGGGRYRGGVRTIVVSDPPPGDFELFLERRRRLGNDLHDEVWAGVLHVNPGPHARHAKVQFQLNEMIGPVARAAGLTPLAESNLGEAEDFRVPDGMLLRLGPDRLFNSTAALVVEVVSPGDESWDKLPFYAAHDVEELLIVDPQERSVHWFALSVGEYRPVVRSGLVELGPGELAERIDWPALED